ncbi:hypothetical protein FOA52_010337 [Chlamydomonas sp. UWO 241]|nr:hypothetical protein FOA52_010337 [Chlamydomonas sp. UWO 241]
MAWAEQTARRSAGAAEGGKDREAAAWSPPNGAPAEQQLLYVLRCLDRHFGDMLAHGGFPQLAPVLQGLNQGASGDGCDGNDAAAVAEVVDLTGDDPEVIDIEQFEQMLLDLIFGFLQAVKEEEGEVEAELEEEGEESSAVRATCRAMRVAYDACTTRLVLGGKREDSWWCGVPSDVRWPLQLLSRFPSVSSVTLGWVYGELSLRDVINQLLATQLTSVCISGNARAVTSLAPLAACVVLQHLDIARTEITSLEPLAACVALQHLDIAFTKVASLEPLAACVALQHLNISYTLVATLEPLAAFAVLRHLRILSTKGTSLVPLAACVALQHLDISCTKLLCTCGWPRSNPSGQQVGTMARTKQTARRSTGGNPTEPAAPRIQTARMSTPGSTATRRERWLFCLADADALELSLYGSPANLETESASDGGTVPAGLDQASTSAAISAVPANHGAASTSAAGGAVTIKQEPGSAPTAGQPVPYWVELREAEFSEEELDRLKTEWLLTPLELQKVAERRTRQGTARPMVGIRMVSCRMRHHYPRIFAQLTSGGKDREAAAWSLPNGAPAEQQLLYVLRCLDHHFGDMLARGGFPQLAPALQGLHQGTSGDGGDGDDAAAVAEVVDLTGDDPEVIDVEEFEQIVLDVVFLREVKPEPGLLLSMPALAPVKREEGEAQAAAGPQAAMGSAGPSDAAEGSSRRDKRARISAGTVSAGALPGVQQVAQAAPNGSALCALPACALQRIFCFLQAEKEEVEEEDTEQEEHAGGSAVRATCRALRDAYDVCTTRLVLGGKREDSWRRDPPPNVGWPLRLLSRFPSVSSMTLGWHLNISYTKVTSLAPLAACVALQYLDCDGSGMVDMAPLAAFVALRHLSISDTKVTSLTPLAACVALQYLNISRTEVTSLEPLTSSHRSRRWLRVALQYLNCNVKGVVDLAPLAACVELQHLHISYTQVASLAPLAACVALQHLDIPYTQVASLAPLAACVALQYLNCNKTGVVDLAPLAACVELQHLHISDSKVTSLEPLAACVALQDLCTGCIKVTSLEPLAACVALQLLNYRPCKASDLSPPAPRTAVLSEVRGTDAAAAAGPSAAPAPASVPAPACAPMPAPVPPGDMSAAALTLLAREFPEADAGLIRTLLDDQGGDASIVRIMLRKMRAPRISLDADAAESAKEKLKAQPHQLQLPGARRPRLHPQPFDDTYAAADELVREFLGVDHVRCRGGLGR